MGIIDCFEEINAAGSFAIFRQQVRFWTEKRHKDKRLLIIFKNFARNSHSDQQTSFLRDLKAKLLQFSLVVTTIESAEDIFEEAEVIRLHPIDINSGARIIFSMRSNNRRTQENYNLNNLFLFSKKLRQEFAQKNYAFQYRQQFLEYGDCVRRNLVKDFDTEYQSCVQKSCYLEKLQSCFAGYQTFLFFLFFFKGGMSEEQLVQYHNLFLAEDVFKFLKQVCLMEISNWTESSFSSTNSKENFHILLGKLKQSVVQAQEGSVCPEQSEMYECSV